MAKWQDIEARVLKYVVDNDLQPGASVPSDAYWAEVAGCSKQPVIRALQELERKGVVHRRAGAPSVLLASRALLSVDSPSQDFSFRRSAARAGVRLQTRLLEKSCRPALSGELALIEERARRALGLARHDSFFSVARLRILDGRPLVIHRAYLNPANFSATFLSDHDFEQESLVEIYATCGFRIQWRDTKLRSRMTNAAEIALFDCEPRAILDAEQNLYGDRGAASKPVLIEWMAASYLDWEYHIHDRGVAR